MAKKEITVEEKLRALYDLQLIDSRIDNIRNVRGELPLEVEDLEDEVAKLNTRLGKLDEELKAINVDIAAKKHAIEEAKVLMDKYTKQQENVSNNREFDSLTKEIEYQDLEIQLANKRIKEFKVKHTRKKAQITDAKDNLKGQQEHLKHKKEALKVIISETEKEEALLHKKSEEFSKSLDEHLFTAYSRIRNKVKNGLAVVPIQRGASGGSFFTIPPQVQLDIANRKKITIDEYSGRILVDAALADEEKDKIDQMFE